MVDLEKREFTGERPRPVTSFELLLLNFLN